LWSWRTREEVLTRSIKFSPPTAIMLKKTLKINIALCAIYLPPAGRWSSPICQRACQRP
jgi:hypothetical protein